MIAITGATGLLGSYLAHKFALEGKSVVAIKRENSDLSLVKSFENKIEWKTADILDPISLTESFQNAQLVIHAAGLVSFNPRKSKALFEINTGGTKNVVNACIAAGVKNLIYISSVAALGRQRGVEIINEETKWIDGPLNSDYAKSKYLAELEVYRGQEEGLNVTIINPSVIMAPTDWNKSSARLFKYIWDESRFYTNGYLNYVDVRDVADIAFAVWNKNDFGKKYIASGGMKHFTEVFQAIAHRFSRKAPSVNVPATLATSVAFLEEIKSLLLGYEPVVTRQSVRMTKGKFFYENVKSCKELTFQYRSIETTLDWCCSEYLQRYSTNKL